MIQGFTNPFDFRVTKFWIERNSKDTVVELFGVGKFVRSAQSSLVGRLQMNRDWVVKSRLEALRDVAYYRSFRVHDQFGTIEWDNRADFAPEYLYELTKRIAQQTAHCEAISRRKSA